MLFTLARFLSCGVWLLVGVYNIGHFKQAAKTLGQKGVPASSFFLGITLLFNLCATAMMCANLYVWLAALWWIAFTIPATLLYHGKFIDKGMIVFREFTQIGKNLSLIGGLLAVVALDPALPASLRSMLLG